MAGCGADGLCNLELPGGYCYVDAGEHCCPDGSESTPINEAGDRWCMRSCQRDRDCGRNEDTYLCLEEARICWSCFAADAVVEVGAPCDDDRGCSPPAGVCLTEEFGFPGGYCSQPASVCCPEGSIGLNIQEDPPLPACIDLCQADRDCRPEYQCLDAGDGDSVCWPGGGEG